MCKYIHKYQDFLPKNIPSMIRTRQEHKYKVDKANR